MTGNYNHFIDNNITLDQWLNNSLMTHGLFHSMGINTGKPVTLYIEMGNILTPIHSNDDLNKWFVDHNIDEEKAKEIRRTPFELGFDKNFQINGCTKSIRIILA